MKVTPNARGVGSGSSVRPYCSFPISYVRASCAFTLIEVMLAIAILAVICGTIYQFTNTMVRVAGVSMRIDEQEETFAGLRRLLESELSELPIGEPGAFDGQKDETSVDRRDMLTLLCPAGNALLTPDAHGLYKVSLDLEERPKGSGHFALVLERAPWSESSQSEQDDARFHLSPAKVLPADTVPLLAGVRALEFSYYDPRLNNWLDQWSDATMLPSLVRVRLTMENSPTPYEFTERVPGGGMRRGLPTSIALPAGFGAPTNQGAPGAGSTPPNFTPPPLPGNLQIPPPPPGFPGGMPPSNPRIGAPR